MGIGLGFGDDGNEPPRELDRILPQMVQEMDAQIHRSSLRMNPAYCNVMELLQDDHLSDIKERRASFHCTASHAPLIPLSSLLLMECQHLQTTLRFQLIP
eukprot:1736192-Rhodomonas_salina.2